MTGTRSMIGVRTRATLLTATRLVWPSIGWEAGHRTPDPMSVAATTSADDAARGVRVGIDTSAIVLVPLRLFVGVIWLRAAAEKIIDPAWWDGSTVEAFVTSQLAAGAVATEWCARLAETVLLPNAQAVSWVVVVLQTLTGLAILLGVATATFLVVGIAMNVAFLLMGAVNPSAFYIPMQATLLMGDAGSVAGLEWALSADRARTLRRWHEAVACDTRVWRLVAGMLAVIAALATVRISAFTPADLVGDPFAVLALLSGIGALGALIHADGQGADHRWRARTRSTARTPTPTSGHAFVPHHQQPARPDGGTGDAPSSTTEPRACPDVTSDDVTSDDVTSDDTATGVPPRRGRRPTTRGMRFDLHRRDRSEDRRATRPAPTTPDAAVRDYMACIRDPVASGAGHEAAFVEHARAWAEAAGVSGKAFAAEGVPADVLRRAGFRDVTDDGRPRTRRRTGAGRRASVTADGVRTAIPSGTFTVRRLQELSGASAATVRRVIGEGVRAGSLIQRGVDSDHDGPGRAPTTYERS